MPFLNHEIVGTIALSPASEALADRSRLAEETTLGDLLACLAEHSLPAAGVGQPRRLVASTRISRFIADETQAITIIRADMSRLTDQLAHEYAEVAGT